jgi:hypothetical protein
LQINFLTVIPWERKARQKNPGQKMVGGHSQAVDTFCPGLFFRLSFLREEYARKN